MYGYDAVVRYTETGGRLVSRVDAIANYFQDCAILDSEEAGIGLQYMAKNHVAWFLIFLQIKIRRYPVLGEKIRVTTWPYGFSGFMGLRNAELVDEAGVSIAQMASIWSFMNIDRMRPEKISDEVGYSYTIEDKLDMEYAPRKIKLLQSHEIVGRCVVSYNQIDSNNHMNNQAYIALALQYSDFPDKISELRAEYRQQFVKDETIVIKKGVACGCEQFVMADLDDRIRCVISFMTKTEQ